MIRKCYKVVQIVNKKYKSAIVNTHLLGIEYKLFSFIFKKQYPVFIFLDIKYAKSFKIKYNRPFTRNLFIIKSLCWKPKKQRNVCSSQQFFNIRRFWEDRQTSIMSAPSGSYTTNLLLPIKVIS